MGKLIRTGLDAPIRAADALAERLACRHAGRSVLHQACDVTFFGRPARTNPLIARLAQHFDCPIHGVRMVRHPSNHFRLHLTEPMSRRCATPRATSTSQGTMQTITDVIEGWVREHPEQWLWLHRRWR